MSWEDIIKKGEMDFHIMENIKCRNKELYIDEDTGVIYFVASIENLRTGYPIYILEDCNSNKRLKVNETQFDRNYRLVNK